MYDNWLFFPTFLFSTKKKREVEKENELGKPVVLNKFFSDPLDFHPLNVVSFFNTLNKKKFTFIYQYHN